MELRRRSRFHLTVVFAALSLALSSSCADATGGPARSQSALVSEDDRLDYVFADDARREDAVNPLNMLYRGEAVDPEVFAQLFTDTLARRQLSSARQSLSELRGIDRAHLNPRKQLSYDVFSYEKREEAAWLKPDMRALTSVRPFNHFGGLHIEFPSLMSSRGAINFESEADYRRALMLDAAFARVLDNATAKFREGMKTGVVETQLTVRNMIAQIDALLAQPVEQSPFYSPVLEFPESVPASRRPKLRRAFANSISRTVYPAYGRFRVFLAEEYLPAARESVGLSAMKGGASLYRRLIERETTLRLDPEEVHRLGLSEVARIRLEMESVRREMGFEGTLHEFFEHIRTDPQFHPASRKELEQGFARIGREVDRQIPRLFTHVPKTPLLIQPYPAYREKYEPGGSYQQGSSDAKRPGIFYFNSYDLPSRYLTGMTTLYLHEGSPGHHFQISLAQEDESLPDFQKFDGNNAFVEGWALYAETLGYEMGFYKDPGQRWGTLDDEMLRAMRLVVDTGIHAKGWSREQAIDYMLANSGMGRTDATSEVERYIANPAQALSYKIGALTIQRLRRKAERELGDKFDIREFHDQVLDSGALPLPILEEKIESWIANSR
ncbi:MAG: DUF885 domain-containing protein [Novosphingobium sp.]|nr:DUF885 domain-containing protein [Novosphingobium sp.]